jgi:hypothetical protein
MRPENTEVKTYGIAVCVFLVFSTSATAQELPQTTAPSRRLHIAPPGALSDKVALQLIIAPWASLSIAKRCPGICILRCCCAIGWSG